MKIASKLPQGNRNGLAAIETDLAQDAEKIHTCIALVKTGDRNLTENGEIIPTVRFVAIEVITEDIPVLRRLLQRAKDQRTGEVVLPYETEEELETIFDGIDLSTGEVIGESPTDDTEDGAEAAPSDVEDGREPEEPDDA